jgi:hypothetical protein
MIELTKLVMLGELDGFEVWVCHYNRPDLQKKALRNTPPTKCMVRPISELPKNKTVYYSESFYSPISKGGKVTAKIISPVDNTGYRSHCGNMLYTFRKESDCIAEWNRQIEGVSERIQIKIDNAASAWKEEKEDLRGKLCAKK